MSNPNVSCFVAMPISDIDGYDVGHFSRVYEHLIVPACRDAKVIPVRADDVKATNYIVLDILHRLVTADVVICDLSGRNPNVLYELGIRQAFDRPVVLIKDRKTDRIFDIQGIRTVEYDETLRVDAVEEDRSRISEAVASTRDGEGVNSLVSLLSVTGASISEAVSADTAMIMSGIQQLGHRLTHLENLSWMDIDYRRRRSDTPLYRLPNGEPARDGTTLFQGRGGPPVGILRRVIGDVVVVARHDGEEFTVVPGSEEFKTLTTLKA